jgi:hypothetical protein
VAINRTAADAYFASHMEGGVWSGYTTGQREAAIAQAKRELGAFIGGALSETATANGDSPRHDCAAYEYAYRLLLNSRNTATASDTATPDVAFEQGGTGRRAESALTPLVLRFLGVTGRISRG